MSRRGVNSRQILKLWNLQAGLCYWCRKETFPPGDPRRFRPVSQTLSGKAATIEHMFARGDPRRETSFQGPRKVMACSTCNGKRGRKTPEEFKAEIDARNAKLTTAKPAGIIAPCVV